MTTHSQGYSLLYYLDLSGSQTGNFSTMLEKLQGAVREFTPEDRVGSQAVTPLQAIHFLQGNVCMEINYHLRSHSY